jgi:hypothetical protein
MTWRQLADQLIARVRDPADGAAVGDAIDVADQACSHLMSIDAVEDELIASTAGLQLIAARDELYRGTIDPLTPGDGVDLPAPTGEETPAQLVAAVADLVAAARDRLANQPWGSATPSATLARTRVALHLDAAHRALAAGAR